MKVEFLGQAATLTTIGPTVVLSDPWFSGMAHQSGWRPFPNWGPAELRALRTRADTANHVYLSHDHEDHFDPAFLAALAPKTFLVGEFRNERFHHALTGVAATAGHCVRRLGHGQPFPLPGDATAQVFLEQPAYRTNSVLLLRGPGGSLLNANDCGLDPLLLRSIARDGRPTVFLSTLNFLANGYPFPYLRRGDPQTAVRAHAVRDGVVASFRTAMEILRPVQSVAFAGPITFANAVNDYLDDLPEARDWRRMVSDLRDATGMAVDWPAPGSVILLDAGKVATSQLRPWDGFEATHRAAYRAAEQAAAVDIRELVAAAEHLAVELCRYRPARPWSTSLVLSAVGAVHELETGPVLQHIVCTLGDGGPAVHTLGTNERVPEPHLQIIATADALLGLCDGSLEYDGFLLSGRARLAREPERFDSILHDLLRFGRDPARREALLAWWARPARVPETLVKFDGATQVTVPRLCPHEGEPFDLVEICAGRLVCPRHRWVFDVASGACLDGDPTMNLYT